MNGLLGKHVGHFRVVDVIGKGGMGEIYVGYDEKLERKVALKTIKAERRLDATAKARFSREAKILSQLQHPNICQIYDLIECEDADVLVLELVKGSSLSETLKKGLTFRQKLVVALQIARVLVAAHEKGIVHRDLKPDNVMLDDEGEVKVLDFGLSRSHVDESTLIFPGSNTETATRADEEDPTFARRVALVDSSGNLTTAGQVMGTLGYMSPEQARGEPAQPASDMYSFGLMLQEVFTGKPPYETSASPRALLQKAQGGESQPVDGIDPDVASLIKRLKSLAPAARPSAIDAAERIQWILDKPARRTKRVLAAGAFVVLVLFGTLMTIQSIRARRAERIAAQAEASARRAEAAAKSEAMAAKQVTEFLVTMFNAADPMRQKGGGGNLTVKELLDRGVAKIERELKHQPLIRATLLNAVGSAYAGLALHEQAYDLVEEGLKIREGLLPADDLAVGESLLTLGGIYAETGRLDDATRALKRSLVIFEKQLVSTDEHIEVALNNLAGTLWFQQRYEEAQPIFRRSLVLNETVHGPNHPKTARTLNNLGAVAFTLKDFDEAERCYRRALAAQEGNAESRPVVVAVTLYNLGEVCAKQNHWGEAEMHLRRSLAIQESVFGPDHPDVARGLAMLASTMAEQAKYAEAEDLFVRSMTIFEARSGRQHADAAEAAYQFGRMRARQGRQADALSLLRRAATVAGHEWFMESIRLDFAPLAGDPDFEKIAAQVEAAQQAKR